MAGGFGKKGVVAGAPVARNSGYTTHAPARDAPSAASRADDLSPAARAFLAAERARAPEQAMVEAAPARAAESALRWAPEKPKSERKLWIAYVLWWFATPLAAHRFYLGAYRSGLAMFGLFWGGLAIAAVMSKQSSLSIGGYFMPPPGIAMVLVWMLWALLDVFLIPGVRRRHAQPQQARELSAIFA